MNEFNSAPSPVANRELAKTILSRRVRDLKIKLAGAEHLLKIAEKLEDGSPGEAELWSLLQGMRNL